MPTCVASWPRHDAYVPNLPVRCSAIDLVSNTRVDTINLYSSTIWSMSCAKSGRSFLTCLPSASRYCRYSISNLAAMGTGCSRSVRIRWAARLAKPRPLAADVSAQAGRALSHAPLTGRSPWQYARACCDATLELVGKSRPQPIPGSGPGSSPGQALRPSPEWPMGFVIPGRPEESNPESVVVQAKKHSTRAHQVEPHERT